MCTLPLCPIDFSDSQFRGGEEDQRRRAEECKEEVGRRWGGEGGVGVRNQNMQTLDKTSNATLGFKPCVFYLHSISLRGTLSSRLWEKHVVALIKWPEPTFDKSTRFVSMRHSGTKTVGNVSINYETDGSSPSLIESHLHLRSPLFFLKRVTCEITFQSGGSTLQDYKRSRQLCQFKKKSALSGFFRLSFAKH